MGVGREDNENSDKCWLHGKKIKSAFLIEQVADLQGHNWPNLLIP
jgi:hypothetical protein